MPVIAKFRGIVIRLLTHQTFGTRFHAFYGDSELVVGINPLRVVQGDTPGWVTDWVLDWVRERQGVLALAAPGVSRHEISE